MALNTQSLSLEIYRVYQETLISLQVKDLVGLKEQIKEKTISLSRYRKQLAKFGDGREYVSFLKKLSAIESEYTAFEEDFHDKLMIFIVGDGNVGKSTLLNTFVGYEAAKTSFAPLTWKIDVFDPGQKETALLKLNDGSRKTLTIEKAKIFLSEEEAKTLVSRKKYNEELRSLKNTVKTSAEMEEHKKYLGKKLLYVSPVTEARWPVKHNWILNQCLLVDTPGMNQYLNDHDQVGNITDYYHKADGIIWLLDGNTIASSNPKTALENLESSMSQVGGIRDNIIAVINKIDLVEKNGGEQGVLKVLSDAHSIYKDKFRHIVGISSKLAYEGMEKNDALIIEQSGIHQLTQAIKEVFISKSQEVKTTSKMQGNQKLMNLVRNDIADFTKTMNKHQMKYMTIQSKLQPLREELVESLSEEVDIFMDNYLKETNIRITMKVDSLSEGKGEDFIINEMYQIDELTKKWNKLLTNQRERMTEEAKQWREFSMISEYNYIRINNNLSIRKQTQAAKIEGTSLKAIKYFTPVSETGFFSMVGNLWGKVAFSFRKSGYIEKILQEITKTCENMKNTIFEDNNVVLVALENECREILYQSFSKMLLPHDNFSDVVKATDLFLKEFNKMQKSDITLTKVLMNKKIENNTNL